MGGIQFSAEDMAVIKQCEVESLMKRSIPIGTALGVATYTMIQKGILQPSAKYGPTPKVIGACILGYIIGKLSYQSVCAEKLMRLPNSQIGEMLRRRKGGFMENFTSEGGLSMAPFSSRSQQEVYTDEGQKPQQKQQGSSLDFDRPVTFSGLDDNYRPSLDSPERNFNDNLPNEPPKHNTSYEELRLKNRDEYNRRLHAPFNQAPVAPPPAREDQLFNGRPDNNPRNDGFFAPASGLKTRYGDEWK